MYWNIIQQQSFIFFKDFFLVFTDFIWQYSVEETEKQRESGGNDTGNSLEWTPTWATAVPFSIFRLVGQVSCSVAQLCEH